MFLLLLKENVDGKSIEHFISILLLVTIRPKTEDFYPVYSNNVFRKLIGIRLNITKYF